MIIALVCERGLSLDAEELLQRNDAPQFPVMMHEGKLDSRCNI